MVRQHQSTLLLVDGYNMIGAWPSLKKVLAQSDLETARHALVESLIGYSTYRGYRTQVVFDAYTQQRPLLKDSITPDLTVSYTAYGQTADSYIERACARLKTMEGRGQRLIVATSDRSQQLTVVGYGAEWMSARQLESDVQAAAKLIRRLPRKSTGSTRRYLMHSIDQRAKERLSKMRFGLE